MNQEQTISNGLALSESVWNRAHCVDHALSEIDFRLFWDSGCGDDWIIIDSRGFQHGHISGIERDLTGIIGDELIDGALSRIPDSIPTVPPQPTAEELECLSDVTEKIWAITEDYEILFELRDRIWSLNYIPDSIITDLAWMQSPKDIAENLDWLIS